MALIKGIQAPKAVNPRTLVIFSLPKSGKTEALAQLDNHIILDFDGSSEFYKCNAVVIDSFEVYVEFMKELKAAYDANNFKPPFKYGIIDTITEASDAVIRALAVRAYNKDEADDKPLTWDITSLGYGKGHAYISKATKKLIDQVSRYVEYTIVVGHSADKAVMKDGKDLTIKELDLPGKLKNALAAKVDGLALLYRKEKNINVLSFLHDEESVLGGTRSPHLSGREIVISEKNEDGTLSTFWDKIYI